MTALTRTAELNCRPVTLVPCTVLFVPFFSRPSFHLLSFHTNSCSEPAITNKSSAYGTISYSSDNLSSYPIRRYVFQEGKSKSK